MSDYAAEVQQWVVPVWVSDCLLLLLLLPSQCRSQLSWQVVTNSSRFIVFRYSPCSDIIVLASCNVIVVEHERQVPGIHITVCSVDFSVRLSATAGLLTVVDTTRHRCSVKFIKGRG